MQLLGLHHVTAITADGPANHAFYVGVLCLRLVKKTVNFYRPHAYHLSYGDERGSPGSAMTFFEFPGTGRGGAGAGMVDTIAWRVATPAALEFWGERLARGGRPTELRGRVLASSDPEGLALELHATDDGPALAARHDDVATEHALQGILGVRGGVRDPDGSQRLLDELLPFAGPPPIALAPAGLAGAQGAGTVHHVAFHSADDDLERWQSRTRDAGLSVTNVKDRQYFRSIYFREPGGILYELATTSP